MMFFPEIRPSGEGIRDEVHLGCPADYCAPSLKTSSA